MPDNTKEPQYFLTDEQLETHLCLKSLPKAKSKTPGAYRGCICGAVWMLRSTIKNDTWTGKKKYWVQTKHASFDGKQSIL